MDLDLILIPVLGYICLWLLASPLFILYFRVYKVPIDLKNTVSMIRKLPDWLAIITVPVCSFFAFFLVTKVIFYLRPVHADTVPSWEIGVVALVLTVILDILITVLGEKINILKYPVNLMYLLAYIVIVPAVLFAS